MLKPLRNKKLIFFDGDGTMWYPKKTKRSVAPHWIYEDAAIGKNFLHHLVLIPSVLKTLKELKKRGFILTLISTHPHPPKIARALLQEKITHFKLGKFFDEFHAAGNNPQGKGKIMLEVLKKRNIPKSQALMIGDSYTYDYLSAKKVGIDCILMKSEYLKPKGRRIKRVMTHLEEIFILLG